VKAVIVILFFELTVGCTTAKECGEMCKPNGVLLHQANDPGCICQTPCPAQQRDIK
jgi:hypothetical protein